MAGLSDLAIRILINAQDRTGPAVNSARAGQQALGDSLTRVETIAKRVVGLALFANWAQEGIKLSDTYKGLAGRLQQTVGETGNLAAKQEQLFAIAQRTYTPLEQTVQLYARGSQALEKYSDGQALAAKLTETVNYSFKAQASSAAEVSSTITQLTQAIATDAVQWEDFGQLADTNLMLVNVAAKNLGYDGLGALKQAMADGKVGNVELVDAIVKGFDEIKAAADKMPVTVEAAWTKVRNATLKYVGDSTAAGSATAKLAGLLELLADNIKPLADLGILLAEVYGARVVLGLIKSAEAYLENKAAAEEMVDATEAANEAAEDSRRIELQVAQIRVRTARALIEEARLQAALASTEVERAQAQNLLAQAMRNYHGAVDAANAAQEALGGETEQSGEQISRFAGILGRLRGLVEKAFTIKIAIDAVGSTLETLGEYNEKIRIFSFAWQATIEELEVTAAHFLSGDFLETGTDGLRAKFDAIQQKYGDLAVASTDSARAVAEAEQKKTKEIEAATLKQQQAFAVVQESTKQLTASIDAGAKAQTAAVQQSLAERLAAIDAMNLSEAEKDNLRVQAKLESYNLELELQTQAGNAKLALIDQEYQAELAHAADNAQRTAEIETQKRQAKLSVYSGLAEYYQGEVARLSQVYAGEYQAAQSARQQLQALNKSHEQALFDIALMGLSEREKLSEREYKFNENMRNLRAELAKGDQGDQTKINSLLDDAKKLHGEITSAAGKGSSAIYDAKKRENEIFKAQTEVLERNAGDHEKNAGRAKAAQDEVAAKLAETQAAVTDITTKLNQDYALKIGVDEASLTAIKSTIAELTKPETKTITIQTVNAAAPAPAQATGGPAGQPTGRPWRFNTGGYAPRSGKLPGFGGGDKIRALLEAGEFIVRKEAVQALGLPFMHAVNAGRVPTAGNVIKRAMGGSVGYNMDDELAKLQDEREKEQIKRMLANALALGFGSTGGYSSTQAKRTIGQALEKMGRADLKQTTSDIVDNSVGRVSRIGAGTKEMAARNRAKFDRAKVLTEHLFDGDQAGIKTPSIQTPKINIPTPSIPRRPEPTTADSRSSVGTGGTVTVQFKAPNGAGVSAQFDQNGDVKQMIEILKQAGARISGGPF
jgi:tape measure domain-containing protein